MPAATPLIPAHMLVADDDKSAIVLFDYAATLEAPDLTVVWAHGGEACLSYLQTNPPPSVLMLDLRMPKVDGFDVLKALRRNPAIRPARVVVFTASTDAQDYARAFALGADHFLVKPIDFDATRQLVTTLASAIRTGHWPSPLPQEAPHPGIAQKVKPPGTR